MNNADGLYVATSREDVLANLQAQPHNTNLDSIANLGQINDHDFVMGDSTGLVKKSLNEVVSVISSKMSLSVTRPFTSPYSSTTKPILFFPLLNEISWEVRDVSSGI